MTAEPHIRYSPQRGGRTGLPTLLAAGLQPFTQAGTAALALPDLSQIATRQGAAVVHISVSGLSRVSAEAGHGSPEGPAPAIRGQGPGFITGTQPNDLLLAINGSPLAGVEQARSQFARDGKSVALLLQRDGERIFVPVRIG